MKKIFFFLVLCNLSAYAMENKFLDAETVQKLRSELKRGDVVGDNYAKRIYKLLKRHVASGIEDPKVLREDIQCKNNPESEKVNFCVDCKQSVSMYEGMVWAEEIHKKVMQDVELKTAYQEMQEERSFVKRQKFSQLYVIKATSELEKDDPEKILLKYTSNDDSKGEEVFEYISIKPETDQTEINAKIKKLTAYAVHLSLAIKMSEKTSNA